MVLLSPEGCHVPFCHPTPTPRRCTWDVDAIPTTEPRCFAACNSQIVVCRHLYVTLLYKALVKGIQRLSTIRYELQMSRNVFFFRLLLPIFVVDFFPMPIRQILSFPLHYNSNWDCGSSSSSFSFSSSTTQTPGSPCQLATPKLIYQSPVVK